MLHHLHRRGAQNQRCRWVWTGLRTSNEVTGTGRFAMHPLALAIILVYTVLLSARIIGVLSHLSFDAFASYLRPFTINVEYWLPCFVYLVSFSQGFAAAYLMCTLLVHTCNLTTLIVSFTNNTIDIIVGGRMKVQGDYFFKLRWSSGWTRTTRSKSFLSTSSLCVLYASVMMCNFSSVSLSMTDCASWVLPA